MNVVTPAATSRKIWLDAMSRSAIRLNPWRRPGSPASPKNRAYSDHPKAASTPTDTNVSIVAAAWRRFTHAARWNGQAPHVTTGAASVSDNHCQLSNWRIGNIPRTITGSDRTADTKSRRPASFTPWSWAPSATGSEEPGRGTWAR